MGEWILRVAIVVAVVGVAGFAALVITLRTGYPPTLTLIRRMNRRYSNPRVMKAAGQPGSSASVIRHVGRNSGSTYATPIDVVPIDNGFVVVLPYGTAADWLRNVLAAGTAVIDTEGRRYEVGHPQIVGAAKVDEHFTGRQRWTHRLFGIDQFLVLTSAEADFAAEDVR